MKPTLNEKKEDYWELVKIEMEQAYHEHRDTGGRAMDVIKQWMLVVAFPFIVLGASVSMFNSEELKILINSDWVFKLPYGFRPFFLISGVLGGLLIILHNSIDIHKNICRKAMNSFRALYKTSLSGEFSKIGWNYPIRTDIQPMKFFKPQTFTFLFTLTGSLICGFYISIGLGVKNYIWLIVITAITSIQPILIHLIRINKENKVNSFKKKAIKTLKEEKNEQI